MVDGERNQIPVYDARCICFSRAGMGTTTVTAAVEASRDNIMEISKSIVAVEMVEATEEIGIITVGDTMVKETEHMMIRIGGFLMMIIRQGIKPCKPARSIFLFPYF